MDSTQQAFADWRATAAYLFVLHLDPAHFAWEYLRRNPSYCRDWRDVQDPARRWGLELAEDPTRDSRTASPVWCSPRTGITIVADSNPASARFPFWDIPGNKRLCARSPPTPSDDASQLASGLFDRSAVRLFDLSGHGLQYALPRRAGTISKLRDFASVRSRAAPQHDCAESYADATGAGCGCRGCNAPKHCANPRRRRRG
jgi:hypothetical protein